ncbi:hypothetical protein V8D89_002073 [Ganoderma adspersum]
MPLSSMSGYDLTNASPSTDQPTLWLKLGQWGTSGQLINWLRMLYYSELSAIRKPGSERPLHQSWRVPLSASRGQDVNLSKARSGRGPARANRLKERAGL